MTEAASDTLVLWVNATAGFTAALVYILWARMWWRRGSRALAIVNLVVAGLVAGVGVAFGFMAAHPVIIESILPQFLRTGVAAVVAVPAIVRYLELKREERREAIARHVIHRFDVNRIAPKDS